MRSKVKRGTLLQFAEVWDTVCILSSSFSLKPKKVKYPPRQLYISAKEGELQKVVHLLGNMLVDKKRSLNHSMCAFSMYCHHTDGPSFVNSSWWKGPQLPDGGPKQRHPSARSCCWGSPGDLSHAGPGEETCHYQVFVVEMNFTFWVFFRKKLFGKYDEIQVFRIRIVLLWSNPVWTTMLHHYFSFTKEKHAEQFILKVPYHNM